MIDLALELSALSESTDRLPHREAAQLAQRLRQLAAHARALAYVAEAAERPRAPIMTQADREPRRVQMA